VLISASRGTRRAILVVVRVVLDAAAVCSSGPGGDPVGAERIGEGTSVVEQTLRRPGRLRGHRGP
jgi:hypothetical protein